MLRTHLAEETARGLGEGDREFVVGCSGLRRHVGERDPRAEPAADRHFGNRDRKTTVREIVTRLHEAAAAGRGDGPDGSAEGRDIDGWYTAAGHPAREGELAARQVGSCLADDRQSIAGRLEIGRHRTTDVVELAHRSDEQRGRNRDLAGRAHGVGVGEDVVEAILAAHERRRQRDRQIVAGAAGLDERAERLRPPRVTPAEVVEQGDPIGIGSGRDGVGDRLHDPARRHLVGIEPAEMMPEPHAEHDPAVAAEHAANHGPVGRTFTGAEQGLEHRAALHFVVVLPDNPLLARHVGQREHVDERRRDTAVTSPGERNGRRRPVPRCESLAWPAFVKEVAVEVTCNPAVPLEDNPSRTGERADRRGFDALVGGDFRQGRPIARGDGQHHPLLRFRDPRLRGRQSLVLQWHPIEVDVGPERGSHLAHRAREAPGPAVGDGVEEPLSRGLEHEVGEHLFVDRVADLHGAAALGLALARQLDARERGPVDAVTAGSAAGHDDEIARLHGGVGMASRHDAHGPAEHERVADVTRMEGDRAGDRGNAHPVAVVADARRHAGEQPPRVNHAWWDVSGRRVRSRHAEHVEVGDRLGAEPRAEHVADHATEPCRRAAVGLDRRGMVVRLHLDADVVIAVEPHHSRVVLEDAHAPVARAERLTDRPRGGEYRLFQEVVVAGHPGGAAVIDGAGERLVAAVLAPGLGDRFEFDLERAAAERLEMVADGVQFANREG